MKSIDEIMDMLDWNNPDDVQAHGRALAREIRCINVFLQPGHKGHKKNVWENCALILAGRSDEELRPYLYDLLDWLADMNWPGAPCIRERLMRYKDFPALQFALNESIKTATALGEENHLQVLQELQREMEQTNPKK